MKPLPKPTPRPTSHLVRRTRRAAIALLPLCIACGPFFYQAPPPLSKYPERTAGKTWFQLLQETHPIDESVSDSLTDETRKTLLGLPGMEEDARLSSINKLIQRNQSGHFDRRIGNLLLEAVELIKARTPGYQEYLVDRIESIDQNYSRRPVKLWNQEVEDHEKALRRYEMRVNAITQNFDNRIKQATPELAPNLRVQLASATWQLGEFQLAHETFSSVTTKNPDHPRADVARFMIGRCTLEFSRLSPEEERPPLQLQAEEELNHYLKSAEVRKDARFVDDAHGWFGAVASDRGHFGQALNQQIKRLEFQQTREVTRSTLRECDSLIGQLFDQAVEAKFWEGEDSYRIDEPNYDLLATNSQISRLFLFHALDPAYQTHFPIYSGNESGDRGTLEFLKRNIISVAPFARHSLKELGRAIGQSETSLDPTSCLILGWASLRNDDPDQALALFERGLESGPTDELLHARAATLARLKRHREAADSYEELLADFSDSPLSAPSRFDHAIELQRSGEAGEALLILLDLNGFFDRSYERSPDLYLRPENEVIQWIDTLAQFSPIEELRRPLDRLPTGDPRLPILQTIVRSRALCSGDYKLAAELLDKPDESSVRVPGYRRRWNPHRQLHLTPVRWEEELGPFLNTARTLRLAAPNDPGLASVHLRHARQWQALRGKFTLPFYALFDYSQSEDSKLEQLRRNNARILGLDDDTILAELESRDELQHALGHYLKAAELSDHPNIVAPALEGANEALFRLAEFSFFRCSRAAETDASELSAEIVARLEKEFPDRPETQRAVRYTFLPPNLLGDWMPGDYNPGNSDYAIAETLMTQTEETETTTERYNKIQDALNLLPHSDQTLEQIRSDLGTARSEFDAIRGELDAMSLLQLVDDLDDLHAAAHTPGVTADELSSYATTRLSDQRIIDRLPDDAPLSSFVAFLKIIRSRGIVSLSTAQRIERWNDYLSLYPDSPKAEAASLRRLRLIVREQAPIPHVHSFHFPEAPIPNGYKRVVGASGDPDTSTARKALNTHLDRFPDGRYEADLALLRGALESREGSLAKALLTFNQLLADPNHSELHGDTALYFSEIAQRLIDPAQRSAIASAFRNNPEAMAHLRQLAQGDTCLSRLRPMLPWLQP